MTAFQELDEYLAQDFEPDYWYDEGEDLAEEMVASFKQPDWSALAENWPQRPPAWQQRCAYTLVGTRASDSAAILLGMAQSADDDVAATAVDALNHLRWEDERPALAPGLIARLGRLGANRPERMDAIRDLRRLAKA